MRDIAESFSKTRGQGLTGQLAEHVREYIFDNGFRPGDRLPAEQELARQFKVSRGTLREAIKALAVAGLLESKPRAGTRVREFSYKRVTDTIVNHFYLGAKRGLEQVLEVRAMLELSALPLVVHRINAEQIDELWALESDFEEAVARRGDVNQRDMAFHAAILRATGNELMIGMVGLLRAFFTHPLRIQLMHERFEIDEAERTSTIEEHRSLIEALAVRNTEEATSALKKHFGRAITWLEPDAKRRPRGIP